MTTAQVVETPVTVNKNSLIQDYVHPDEHTKSTYEMTPGFKPFTKLKFKHKISYLRLITVFIINMAEPASGRNEANPVFWLATWAGKTSPSCPLGISHFGPARKSSLFGYIINPLLPKLDRSRWLEVYWPRSLIVCVFIDLDFFSATNIQKRTWPIFSHFGLVFGQ